MNPKDNYQPVELPPAGLEKEKQLIDRHFIKNTGLCEDVINDWQAVILFWPVKHYEEYYREKYPQLADYIMEKSSPEKVKEFNKLADEFNSKLEQIKANNDQAAIDFYLSKAVKLIRG